MLLGSGLELASRFQKLGSHLLKVLHFVPTAFRCAEYNWIWGSVVCSVSDSPADCRTACKLCKCYAALGLNHRFTGPAHPRHALLAVVFVAGHDLPAVTVSEREPSLTHPSGGFLVGQPGMLLGLIRRAIHRPGDCPARAATR